MPRVIDAFSQFFDNSGDPLIDGFLKFHESGTSNIDKKTFADINEQIENANPVPLNASGRCPNVFGTGSYNVISYTSTMVQIEQFDPIIAEDQDGTLSAWDSKTNYIVDDKITASNGVFYKSLVINNVNNNPLTSPSKWAEIRFTDVWNASASYSTNNIVELTGKLYRSKINLNVGNNPITSTSWEDLSEGGIYTGTAIGTPDNIIAVLTPTLTSLTNGVVVFLKAGAPNSVTAPTFDPDGLGALPITKLGNQPLAVGDISGANHELILKYNSTTAKWELLNPANAFRGALLYSTTPQPLTSGVNEVMLFDSAEYDTDNIHDPVFTSRAVVPAGVTKVIVSAKGVYTGSTAGSRNTLVKKNGSTAYRGLPQSWGAPPSGSASAIATITSPVIKVTGGDYFELIQVQDSGSTLSAPATAAWLAMEIIK